jgi:hypothetical protein
VSELIVSLKKLHSAQNQVLSESKRFNVLKNGRRWGKTELAKELAIQTMLDGHPVGYWCPTYKDLYEFWNELKYLVKDITRDKSETVKQIVTITGGKIDCWSMEDPNSGRGRFYKRAIVDEAEKAPKFEEAWKQTIRPTLTDLRGDAWILSTPKGINTYFHQMFSYKEKFNDWMSWQMPTVSNPFIDPAEVAAAESQLDPFTFKQEYLAESLSHADKPFMYCFTDKHINDSIEFNPRLPVMLSFDFNVDPCTCVIGQVEQSFIHVLDEVRLLNAGTEAVCDAIITKPWYNKNLWLQVTGDVSGLSRDTRSGGGVNDYTIIARKLGIMDRQLKLPKKNPPISESKTLCNSILSRHKNVFFHPRCKYTIDDMRFVQVKENGDIDKGADAHKSHLLDCVRYLLNTWKGDFILKGF